MKNRLLAHLINFVSFYFCFFFFISMSEERIQGQVDFPCHLLNMA